MLKKLVLTNFRKHTDLTIRFTDGLNCVRAANEAGKSTLTEGILYALYGASLLRTSLDEAVTWGQKASTLRVELEIEMQGKAYTFARSSAGAEVQVDGKPFVTGQKEVSAFASHVLGSDGKAAQRLIFSNQNAIRGALEDGPKAVATQIENLCDFDIFDKIIESMQEKLVLGSPSILEARLLEAEDKAACFVEPTPPNIVEITKEVETMKSDLVKLSELDAQAEKDKTVIYAAWQNAENAQRMHNTIATSLRKHEEDLKLHTAQLAAAEVKAKQAPDQATIDALKVQLSDAQTHTRRVLAYTSFTKLIYPELFWEGDRLSLTAEVEKTRTLVAHRAENHRSLQARIESINTQVKTLRSKIITSLTCPTCHQEVKNKGEIKAQNSRLEDEIKAIEAPMGAIIEEAALVSKSRDQAQADLADLLDLERTATGFDQFAAKCGEFVSVDLNYVPPKLTWNGLPPDTETYDQAEIKKRLSSLEQSQDEARRAEGQAEALRQAVANDNAAIANARNNLTQYPSVANVETLKKDYDEAYIKVLGTKAAIVRVQNALTLSSSRIECLQTEYAQAVQRGKEIKEAVEVARKDLESLAFNNTLLKKIRTIRPLVADKLWNQVLAAVSTMFSSIRGERSVVTKDKDGFKVNGQAVESLSGSTLDALGVAIRTALVRTFLPHCRFSVMDEPAQGCDVGRTTNLLGFMASAGYDQTLLITHEEVSESFADNLITL